jgi:ribosome-associated toxin RatA of RatAB toxin-antitoxin module
MGCRESYVIERADDQLLFTTFRYNLPFKFRPREFVLRAQFYQNPKNKEVLLAYSAVPEKLPPNPCCFRVTDMNNTWRFTPLGNGQVEVEFLMNMDDGGFMPDLLINKVRPQVMFKALPRLQSLLNTEK